MRHAWHRILSNRNPAAKRLLQSAVEHSTLSTVLLPTPIFAEIAFTPSASLDAGVLIVTIVLLQSPKLVKRPLGNIPHWLPRR